MKLLGQRRRFLTAGLSAAAIGLYTVLVGAEAAVVRAALMGSLGQAAIPIHAAESGQALHLGQGTRLQVLATSSSGAVLLLEWRSFRLLLPIGLDDDLCQSLLEDPSPQPVTALLLDSSGAADLNPPAWLQAWDPQLVLISVAPGDRRARPAPEVLQAVQGRTLLRTDQNGWVELTTDWEKLWVEVERTGWIYRGPE